MPVEDFFVRSLGNNTQTTTATAAEEDKVN